MCLHKQCEATAAGCKVCHLQLHLVLFASCCLQDSDLVMPPKSSVSDITEDKSVVTSTPFKAPVPPPVVNKDTPAKSDKKLDELLCSYLFLCADILIL